MRIAIIDDEEDARYILKNNLNKCFGHLISNLEEADSVSSGFNLLNNQSVDLLFLDIKMNDGTGFDLLEKLPKLNSKIIFVTAYNDFALRAFEFYAFAYIVKPFKISTLKNAVDRILENPVPVVPEKSIEVLASTYQEKSLQKIVVPEIEGFKVIKISDIIYLKSDNNYTEFKMKNDGQLISSKTLKEYERLLTSEGFFRIHRSYLINLSLVQAYSKIDGSEVILSESIRVPIGRRKLSEFKKIFLG